jgi:protein-export membrane protein SecD
MKQIGLKLSAVFLLTILSLGYILPLKEMGVTLPKNLDTGTYKLGLDLHGWVELDYKIDFQDMETRGQKYNATEVTEGLKSIVEKRVNSLGTAEPTITSATYGNESHIIVQIPTQTFKEEGLSEEQIRIKNKEYIEKAKETIGKVVRLEFKEEKTTVTEADKTARKAIATSFQKEVTAENFEALAKKYTQNNEMLTYLTGSKVETEKLPFEIGFKSFTDISKNGVTQIIEGETGTSYGIENGQLKELPGEKVFVIANIQEVTPIKKEVQETGTGSTASGATTKKTVDTKEWTYQALVVSQKPSQWMPAQTADGRILDEKYLVNANASFSQGFTPQVDLVFNEEGKAIFAELTKRLIGKPIAIFVGGQMVSAPIVQAVIPDGLAVITGSFTAEEATGLATDIKTGKVPAPIYLTSERAIDAKIGNDALLEIIIAGAIGLFAIVLFLGFYYRVSGLLAGVALIVYAVLLVAIFKAFGIVLTLASIAGMILSIGLAIDANILIFERTKEALRENMDTNKAIGSGFEKSWTTIWDSHITSLTSAVVLYVFGTSIIKGFGLALGLGIVLSLFTAMWVSRVLIHAAGNKMQKNTKAFIGISK